MFVVYNITMTLIIDADSIPYLAAYTANKNGYSLGQATGVIDSIIRKIFKNTNCTHFIAYVTGKRNFRFKVDATYKAQRDDKFKEENELYRPLVSYMIARYSCITVNGAEADDLCSISHAHFDNSILAAIDKDLLQSPGKHYNYRTDTFFEVEYIGDITRIGKKCIASGRKCFWMQMITGDSVDNIKGIRGKGPAFAYKLLCDLNTDSEMELAVREEYLKKYGNQANEEFNKNYKLLYMPSEGNIELPIPIDINNI